MDRFDGMVIDPGAVERSAALPSDRGFAVRVIALFRNGRRVESGGRNDGGCPAMLAYDDVSPSWRAWRLPAYGPPVQSHNNNWRIGPHFDERRNGLTIGARQSPGTFGRATVGKAPPVVSDQKTSRWLG